jgi:hypothetical protein
VTDDIAKFIQDAINEAIAEAKAEAEAELNNVVDPLEYYYVVKYSQDRGWVIDSFELSGRFYGKPIWDPDHKEWHQEMSYQTNYAAVLQDLLERLT